MNNTQETTSSIHEPKRHGRLADFFISLWKEKPLGTVCGMIVLLFIVVAVFAEVLAPCPFDEVHLPAILKAPSAQFQLGADQLGRDLLSRLIFRDRVSMLVGLGRNPAQCGRRYPDWWHFRIPWRAIGPGLRSVLSMPGWPFRGCCSC